MAYAIAFIHKEPGTDYGVSFPDFPGCISTGKNVDEAITKGSAALSFHVAGMAEDGDAIPMLRSYDEIIADKELREWADGAIVAAIPFELPAKAVRVNISIDEHLLEQLDGAAKSRHMSRSAFIASAVRKEMVG
jgi:predicted RNase H-like HicB family nuclease